MKLIWHIIRKDMVRDRWALALWAALFVAQVVIGLVLLQDVGSIRDLSIKLQLASVGLVFAQFISGYVLVVRLVHADPLFGTDMFWATRPITRRRLLAAKAGAALLLFGLLPVLLLMPWWLWCGFTARDLFWSAVETFGWQLLMIAPAFLIATLTNELARTLLWTVVLFIGIMGSVAALGSAAAKSNRLAEDAIAAVPIGVAYTRTWLTAVLAVAFSFGIAAHHYITNRLGRSILLTMLGVGVLATVLQYGPWDWHESLTTLNKRAVPPEIAAAIPAVEAKAGVSMPTRSLEESAKGRIEKLSLNTEVYFENLPAGTTVSTGMCRLAWRWPDGLEIKRVSYLGSSTLPVEPLLRRAFSLANVSPDAATVSYYQAQQAKRESVLEARRMAAGIRSQRHVKMLAPSQPGQRALLHTEVPLALVGRAQKNAPAFEARLECAILQPVILAELPLRVGASDGHDSTRARLLWVSDFVDQPLNNGKIAWLLVTAPAHRDAGPWAVNLFARNWAYLGWGEIWVVNRLNGDCYRTGHYSMTSTRSVIIAGVAMSWNNTRVTASKLWRDEKLIDRDPQWTEHSALVLVEQEVMARFTRTVRIDRQEFKPSLWLDQSGDADQLPPIH